MKLTRRLIRIPVALLTACLASASCTSTHQAAEQAAEAEFRFSLEGGAEGWTAGFADLPVDFDPSIYELDSGHGPLPDGLEGKGLYIQGHNRSDDLFMFFKEAGRRPEGQCGVRRRSVPGSGHQRSERLLRDRRFSR